MDDVVGHAYRCFNHVPYANHLSRKALTYPSNDPKAQRRPLSKTPQRGNIHHQRPHRVPQKPSPHILAIPLLNLRLVTNTTPLLPRPRHPLNQRHDSRHENKMSRRQCRTEGIPFPHRAGLERRVRAQPACR